MRERTGPADWLCLLFVLACAAGARAGYLAGAADYGHGEPALVVQGTGREVTLPAGETEGERRFAEPLDLIDNVREHGWFGTRAPLSDREEPTAHVAPGYPWLVAMLGRVHGDPFLLARWVQVVLGSLTVVCYFVFCQRAYQSNLVATLAGLLAAFWPFWVANTAEIADGTLATFLLAAVIFLGTDASQDGGALTSLLFGLALAGLALVRAALLPFTLVAMMWFLWRCRSFRWGWFAGLLAFLGYGNGLAPWAVRNWKEFDEPVPVVSSAYLDLWVGNHAGATGGPADEAKLRDSLPADVLRDLLDEPNQVRRYARLGPELLTAVAERPGDFATNRLQSGLTFTFGEAWRSGGKLVQERETDVASPPAWLSDNARLIFGGSLLAVLVFGLLGWRWSLVWFRSARLATIATVLVPLPYVLGHGETLSGPRLPFDGLLLCYAAFGIAAVVSGFAFTAKRVDPEPAEA